MIPTRLVLAATILAGLGTACTAVVLGKLGESDGYKTVPNGSSSSSGSSLEACSLRKSDTYGGDHDANACSDCIENSCKNDVAYACNKEKAFSSKPWFREMKDCAQFPWNGFAPPSEGTGFWDCKRYETAKPPISDNGSDTQREVEAHNCINTSCLQGDQPPCKLCEVSVKKSSATSETALLRDDDCGKCFVESCPGTLVECCNTPPMQEFVQDCAFTKDQEKRTQCALLGTAPEDAGNVDNYDDAGIQCFRKLKKCFNQNCASRAACAP